MFCFHLNAGIQKFSSFIRPVDGFSPIYCQQTFLPHNGIFSQISFCWTSNQIVAKIPKTTVTQSRLFLFARAFSPFSSFFIGQKPPLIFMKAIKGLRMPLWLYTINIGHLAWVVYRRPVRGGVSRSLISLVLFRLQLVSLVWLV